MNLRTLLFAGVAACITFPTSMAYAEEHDMHHGHGLHISGGHDHNSINAYSSVGIMGDHMHQKGDWMVSYRYMHMNMEGNRNGRNSLSDDEIATGYANRFANVAMQPDTLRIVPQEMSMDMHMIGAMYAPADWLTLMVMGNYIEKEMTTLTYSGMMGTNTLGENTTKTSGWGDTKLSSLIGIYDHGMHHVHLNLGLSLPTGSIKESDDMLTPMNVRQNMLLGYTMQLGTGTYDLHPGITYTGQNGDLGWGAQYMAEIRLEDENDEGYAWGDKHTLNVWSSYAWEKWFSTTARIQASTQDSIDGIDSQIIGPMQATDPDNYGGETIEVGLGVNFLGMSGHLKDHRIGAEFLTPVYQDLNGPQMEKEYTFTLGWHYSF